MFVFNSILFVIKVFQFIINSIELRATLVSSTKPANSSAMHEIRDNAVLLYKALLSLVITHYAIELYGFVLWWNYAAIIMIMKLINAEYANNNSLYDFELRETETLLFRLLSC